MIKLLFVFILCISCLAQAGVFSYGASGSSGKTYANGQDKNFSEVEFKLNYHIDDTFGVSASIFRRFIEGVDDQYGGRVTLPVQFDLGGHELGLRPYMAPGYSISRDKHAPFVDGGVLVKLAVMRFGVGYRLTLNEVVKNGGKDEAQLYMFFTAGLF